MSINRTAVKQLKHHGGYLLLCCDMLLPRQCLMLHPDNCCPLSYCNAAVATFHLHKVKTAHHHPPYVWVIKLIKPSCVSFIHPHILDTDQGNSVIYIVCSCMCVCGLSAHNLPGKKIETYSNFSNLILNNLQIQVYNLLLHLPFWTCSHNHKTENSKINFHSEVTTSMWMVGIKSKRKVQYVWFILKPSSLYTSSALAVYKM